jgi:hypothetical protein
LIAEIIRGYKKNQNSLITSALFADFLALLAKGSIEIGIAVRRFRVP